MNNEDIYHIIIDAGLVECANVCNYNCNIYQFKGQVQTVLIIADVSLCVYC
jgi:hypothetical protein